MVTDATAEGQAHKFWREGDCAGRQGGKRSRVCLVWIKGAETSPMLYMYIYVYIHTQTYTNIHKQEPG